MIAINPSMFCLMTFFLYFRFANSLFVPFGALLLVMYDKALENDFCAKIKRIVNK